MEQGGSTRYVKGDPRITGPRKPPRSCKRCGEAKILRSTYKAYCDDCLPLVLAEIRQNMIGNKRGVRNHPTLFCKICQQPTPNHSRLVCDNPKCISEIKRRAQASVPSRKGINQGPKSLETRKNMSIAALARRESMSQRAKGPKSPEWRLGQAERVRTGITGYRMSVKSTFTDRRGRQYRMRSLWEVLWQSGWTVV